MTSVIEMVHIQVPRCLITTCTRPCSLPDFSNGTGFLPLLGKNLLFFDCYEQGRRYFQLWNTPVNLLQDIAMMEVFYAVTPASKESYDTKCTNISSSSACSGHTLTSSSMHVFAPPLPTIRLPLGCKTTTLQNCTHNKQTQNSKLPLGVWFYASPTECTACRCLKPSPSSDWETPLSRVVEVVEVSVVVVSPCSSLFVFRDGRRPSPSWWKTGRKNDVPRRIHGNTDS